MAILINSEISLYLNNCYRAIKQKARETATAFYENHPLHLLPLRERYAGLIIQKEQLTFQTETFDCQVFLKEGDQPQFLVRHFTSGNLYFSITEKEKYQQALTLIEMCKANERLLAITGIRLEIQSLETKMAEAFSKGEEPDVSRKERLNYLDSQLQLLLEHDPHTPMVDKPKAKRGPAKKCDFGYLGTPELITSIVNDLNIAIGLLRPPTTTRDFLSVVTAPVPSLVGIPIYIGCNNKQLVYVMDYFHAIFLSFEPANIGNSGLFYSKEGHLLTSHNLVSTDCDHVEKRYAIDAVFRKYGITMPRERALRALSKRQHHANSHPAAGGV